MNGKFLKALEVVLTHEGGYVNHPNDPGGETKYGISKRSYPHLDIKTLSRVQAQEIYYRDWWIRYRYDEIENLAIATKVFDLSVNMGPGRAHRLLQRSVNFIDSRDTLVIDGIIGPLTLTATNSSDMFRLQKTMCYQAAEYYYTLAKQRTENKVFLLGWLNRAYFELITI